jgi:hypothetical protein
MYVRSMAGACYSRDDFWYRGRGSLEKCVKSNYNQAHGKSEIHWNHIAYRARRLWDRQVRRADWSVRKYSRRFLRYSGLYRSYRELKPGVHVTSHGNIVAGLMLRFFLYGAFVAEAVPQYGVRLNSLYNETLECVMRVRRPRLNGEERANLALRAVASLGTPYSRFAAYQLGRQMHYGLWNPATLISYGRKVILREESDL